jgi:hypothetical protein
MSLVLDFSAKCVLAPGHAPERARIHRGPQAAIELDGKHQASSLSKDSDACHCECHDSQVAVSESADYL